MTQDLKRRLDSATRNYRLLDHPFYRAWADGTLSLEDLRHYSAQYFRQVETFPTVLETLAERVPEPRAREIVLNNLRDERDGDHPGLWIRFAEALGVKEDDLRSAPRSPETDQCALAFSEAASDMPVSFALGMLYGYESQTPQVAQTKVQGLKDHYGVDGSSVEYFSLHGELDVEHANELIEALDSVIENEEDEAAAAEGAARGAQAVWHLLDGVVRARAMSGSA
ncbi:MAG: iron-containing redox enzyme family protein [Actinomycetota bacterium]|nr:iron-containing redox enzyme family protein [Actinomycetota bacterium]